MKFLKGLGANCGRNFLVNLSHVECIELINEKEKYFWKVYTILYDSEASQDVYYSPKFNSEQEAYEWLRTSVIDL